MVAEPGLKVYAEPGSVLLERAAARIVSLHADTLPDLSHVVVLLPTLRAAPHFQRVLAAEAGRPALLLPRIATLQSWAAGVVLDAELIPDARRRAAIYEALRDKGWFPGTDLWQVSGEILGLIDEFTRHRVGLPLGLEDFQRQLAVAYEGGRDNAALQFEARLVHELWHALLQDASGVDAISAYQLRLAALARAAVAPLHAIGLDSLTGAEEAFFADYAKRQPVHCTVSAWSQGSFVHDENASGSTEAVAACLNAAWEEDVSERPLLARAQDFQTRFPLSPLQNRLRLFAATSLEDEAQAVSLTVRSWLVAGRRSIAVVAQDRLAARRARALLERAEVLAADESGWTLSTTAASTVVMRWLDVIAGDFYHRDLLDFLKSPFAFADWARASLLSAVRRIEQLIREKNFVSGLGRLNQILVSSLEAKRLIDALAGAAALFPAGRRPLASWLAALSASIKRLGVDAGLAQDAAGCDMLDLLSASERDLRPLRSVYTFSEWRHWLNLTLEAATFRDSSIESPVVLTHVAALELRRFEGLIILGADAAHLPAPSSATLFNGAVRAQLGLPLRADYLRRERAQLIGLIARCEQTLITWQTEKNVEQNPLSPYFARLRAFHTIAYGGDLADRELAKSIARLATRATNVADIEPCVVREAPRPSAPALVPKEITAYGYASLLACPYQFHARHMLGLNEQDEVSEAMEKKDYGAYVHRILHEFHLAHPRLARQDAKRLIGELQRLSDQTFSREIGHNYLSRAWLARWREKIPSYIAWQIERETAGWRWHSGEEKLARDVQSGAETSVRLKGRIDRIDVRPSPSGELEYAVLDYKTQATNGLRKKTAQPYEDAQLPIYALLFGEPIAEMGYVALDQDPVRWLTLDAADLAAANARRLSAIFGELKRGAALPAQGIAQACTYCEMRGLCRKPYWDDA